MVDLDPCRHMTPLGHNELKKYAHESTYDMHMNPPYAHFPDTL